ncbi:MAG: hypothetical protein N2314_09275 [Brevinematales bacterium]|nr:hypothetical protein [Brevinematales bacterium]
MKRVVFSLLWLVSSTFFGIEWLSLEDKGMSYWLETESGAFTLLSPPTNYLYFEGKLYPPTSLFLAISGEEVSPLSFFSPGITQTVSWQKTNHILWGRFLWKGIVYTPAIFLTNRETRSFFLLAIHLSNTTSEAREVGFRFLLDTTFEENTSSPLFWFENGTPISTEREISLNQYGNYLVSSNATSGLFLLPAYNGFSPRAVYLANYHRLRTAGPSISIEPNSPFVYGIQGKRDGAIVVEYRYRLRGKESLEGGIILSREPLQALQWNNSLFETLFSAPASPPSHATPSRTNRNSLPSSSGITTNLVILTNTLPIIKGDSNYLLLQQALLEKLENLIATLSNLTRQSSPDPVSPPAITQSRTSSTPFSSSSPTWFPESDPFAKNSLPPSSQTPPQKLSPPTPQNTLDEAQKTLPVSPSAVSVIFVTNIVTNYVTVSNSLVSPSPLSVSYEEQIQKLQKHLQEIESTQRAQNTSSPKLALIEKRLELLNWLLEKSQSITLSAEDIARMNTELDALLQSLGGGSSP